MQYVPADFSPLSVTGLHLTDEATSDMKLRRFARERVRSTGQGARGRTSLTPHSMFYATQWVFEQLPTVV